jgi:hypothetical protein
MPEPETYVILYSPQAAAQYGYNAYKTPEGKWVEGTGIYPVDKNWREQYLWEDTVEVGQWVKGSDIKVMKNSAVFVHNIFSPLRAAQPLDIPIGFGYDTAEEQRGLS